MKIFLLTVICSSVDHSSFASGLESLFEDESLSVYIRDEKTGANHIYNAERATKQFVAYSTFKIPNSLIALEAGAVGSLTEVFKYDPRRHSSPFRKSPEYNRDQTLESAFKVSALWTFQEIAKRVSREDYAKYLELFEYGNRDVSGDIERFWLERLKISAAEQVRFLQRLCRNDFKLKKSSIEAVKSMMLLDKGNRYRLYGKTGTGRPVGTKWSGWLVGFLEAEGNVYFFAIHTDAETYPELNARRMRILRDSFEHLGVPMDKSEAAQNANHSHISPDLKREAAVRQVGGE